MNCCPGRSNRRLTLTIIDQVETDAGDVIQALQPEPASSSFKPRTWDVATQSSCP